MSLPPRATTTAERLTRLETLVNEIHVAVVGEGPPNTLLERVASLEAEAETSKSWRRQTFLREIVNFVAAACIGVAASLGIPLPTLHSS